MEISPEMESRILSLAVVAPQIGGKRALLRILEMIHHGANQFDALAAVVAYCYCRDHESPEFPTIEALMSEDSNETAVPEIKKLIEVVRGNQHQALSGPAVMWSACDAIIRLLQTSDREPPGTLYRERLRWRRLVTNETPPPLPDQDYEPEDYEQDDEGS